MTGERPERADLEDRRFVGLLTLRGRLTLLAGIATVLVAMAAGQRDVARVGLLLVAVPLISLVLVSVARLRLSARRTVVPQRIQLGSPLVGRITLGLQSRLPIGMVMLEDQVPPELGEQPRFTIDRAGLSWRRELDYPLIGRVRGRWRCGPLTVRTEDAFGMVRRDQRFNTSTEVLVTPQLVPLTSLPTSGGTGSSGESQPQRIGVVGADDVLIREYRHGDDVRRVHWRSTARRGDLMVRREEQSWDPAARIILDSRSGSHAGTGVHNSLEWAVSAAASIGLRFIQDGYRLSVHEADGPVDLGADAATNRTATSDLLVSRLTDLRPRRTFSLRYALQAASLDHSGELVVAVMGRLSPDDAHALLRTRRQRTQGLALLLDVDSFDDPAARRRGSRVSAAAAAGAGSRPEGAGSVGRFDAAHRPADLEETARLLTAEGWRVVRVTGRMSVADAWARLTDGTLSRARQPAATPVPAGEAAG